MRKWNCEVIPNEQLRDAVVEFCQRIKGTPLRVPVRLRGLTSSGRRGGCYYNVNIATKLIGGKSLVGWVIVPPDPTLPPDDGVELMGHAVWLNNQNRASCVTAKSWHTALYTREDGRQFLDMIIWKDNPSSSPFAVYNLYCVREEVSDRYEIVWEVDRKKHSIFLDSLNATKAESLFARNTHNVFEQNFEARTMASFPPDLALRIIIKDHEKQGGFSEPSVATGKSYDDIKNERLGRLK